MAADRLGLSVGSELIGRHLLVVERWQLDGISETLAIARPGPARHIRLSPLLKELARPG
jgi:hypothetical protein